MKAESLVLSHGQGSHVHARDGRIFVDLALGFGAAFLGHAHAAVTEGIQRQAAHLLTSGRHAVAGAERVDSMQRALLPAGLRPAGLYSTGMEVAEFAMRVAAVHTGRHRFAGFARSMHGKSVATAAMCWANAPVPTGIVHTLPFIDELPEDALLDRLETLLRGREIAALFVEPIQGSNAAREASAAFYDRALALCRSHGTLCVFDETITGLYRTGTAFYANLLTLAPDLLLYAKSMGNGFPVSALALREDIEIPARALPGSTFSGNPLAVAAVEATLTAMDALPMQDRVGEIGRIVRQAFAAAPPDVTLRGRGAVWCLEFTTAARADRVRAVIHEERMLVTGTERAIRLLPAVNMDAGLLRECCAKIASACMAPPG